jgi:RimJ/RimL family protein N-acetyltransferase
MKLDAHLLLVGMTDERTITTERLIMSPHSRDDFPEITLMWSDPRVVRFLGGSPYSEEESWARLLRYAGCWALMGFGFWAVRARETGAYLGDIGFLEGRRAGVDGFSGDPEIGWSLNAAAQGHGYATEAVKAALVWGAARFDGQHRRTVAMIHPDNAASVTVAARCGFRHFSVARYKDEPTGLWEYRWPR